MNTAIGLPPDGVRRKGEGREMVEQHRKGGTEGRRTGGGDAGRAA